MICFVCFQSIEHKSSLRVNDLLAHLSMKCQGEVQLSAGIHLSTGLQFFTKSYPLELIGRS